MRKQIEAVLHELRNKMIKAENIRINLDSIEWANFLSELTMLTGQDCSSSVGMTYMGASIKYVPNSNTVLYWNYEDPTKEDGMPGPEYIHAILLYNTYQEVSE